MPRWLCQYFPRFMNRRIETNKTRFLFTQNTATIRRASPFKVSFTLLNLRQREQFEKGNYKIRNFEMIKQGKKIPTEKNKILMWKRKADFKVLNKLLQIENVIEIKNSEVRIHINKTKLKWKIFKWKRDQEDFPGYGKDREQRLWKWG